MEPIPETIEAISQIAADASPRQMLDELQETADQVQRLVPDCTGISIAWIEHGVTFTLVASDEQVALLDALQYLDGGPCEDTVANDRGLATTTADLLDERTWQLFARANAAAGVRSTLSFPLKEHGRVIGSVNLYAASSNAFEDLHTELADLLGSSAPWATRNADFCFDTRRAAEEAPKSLRAQGAINLAIGMLAAQHDTDVITAQERLEEAAARAGILAHQLAEALIRLRH